MKDPASFRDPSGYIYFEDNQVYRVVNHSYQKHFDHLISSGLYTKLSQEKLLVKHTEIKDATVKENAYKVLCVEKIPFITYPYEWSFGQFKAALLVTLKIQLLAVEYNMTLKDATPYNIQFLNNQPIFIDTLSFEIIEDENYAWKPYKQFCEMFLGPILLTKYVNPQLNKLLINNINGLPLTLINQYLPLKSKFSPSVFIHISLHNMLKEKSKESKPKNTKSNKISKSKHLNIITQLYDYVNKLKLKKYNTEWEKYNLETVEEKKEYVNHKKSSISAFIEGKSFELAWDIGANDGKYSRLLSKNNTQQVLSLDIDFNCIEKNYQYCIQHDIKNVMPIWQDFSNPSPSIGWMNKERKAIFERMGTPNLIICLAIIHHLINAGIPLEQIIQLFCMSKNFVIVEYVPITDPKCQIIFQSRGEDFCYPTESDFKKNIEPYFEIINREELNETNRILFYLRKK